MRAAVAVWLALAAVAAGCAGPEGQRAPGRPPAAAGTVHVFAAASLAEPFGAIGRMFEAAHPGTRVSFSFAASSALAAQVGAGAPVDVVATADERTMQRLTESGLVLAPKVFARNRLVILVGKGNPKGIRSVHDLARPGLGFVQCAPEVPCGRLAEAVLARARLGARPRSLEANVKAVVSRVVLGEADAGMVYVSDVRPAGDKAESVEIPPEDNAVTTYPIAVVRSARNRAGANAFVDLVISGAGRAALRRSGFEA